MSDVAALSQDLFRMRGAGGSEKGRTIPEFRGRLLIGPIPHTEADWQPAPHRTRPDFEFAVLYCGPRAPPRPAPCLGMPPSVMTVRPSAPVKPPAQACFDPSLEA